ncbi:MAG: S9 family peptidase, partial [Terriglobales bacterium]
MAYRKIPSLALVSFLCLLSFASLSFAESSAGSFTLEQVLSSPFPSNLVAAQRPGRIAWVFDAKGARNVWVADAPNFEARQVTRYT